MYRDEDMVTKRRRQIDTLKIFNDNVSEVIEDVEYKVDFTSNTNQFSLIVRLVPDFPLEKPILNISPSINHVWVNSVGDEIIGAPGLLNFTIHSDLGRVVQAVIRELQLRPPLIIGHPHNHSSYNYASSSYRSHDLNNSYLNVPSTSHSHARTWYYERIPEINNLSMSELKLLNENEDYLEAFVKKLPQIQHLDNILDSLIIANVAVASENLEKEEKLKEMTACIGEKVATLTQLQEQHEVKQQQYDQMVEKYTPLSIKNRLKCLVMSSDEESEQIAEDFLNKVIDVDKFLAEFTNKRILSHRLRVKEERLSYQLDALQKASY